MYLKLVTVLLTLQSVSIYGQDFPADFIFATATSAYQVEGGWDADGKGESIWDYVTHTNPGFIADQSTGDIACDSYHLWQTDIEILRNLSVNGYRFSISWPRILPDGSTDNINQAGITYYNNIINALISNNIQPLVTIYHWDLPQRLQEIGGWLTEDLIDYYVEYSRVLFENFGDRVKFWITFNEPKQTCLGGYGDGYMAPGDHASGIEDYQCAHNVIRAHAQAWHLYDDEFRASQQGRISITTDTAWNQPASDSADDQAAAEREMEFGLGWYTHPIYTQEGNYPQVMIDRVAYRSQLEGYSQSRLPSFTQEEIAYIRGTWDFFGLNYYTSYNCQSQSEPGIGGVSFYNDKNVNTYQDGSWSGSASDWLKNTPFGLYNVLNYISTNYQNPEIYITENGFSDYGDLNDQGRIDYYSGHLQAVAEAIADGIPVRGYTAWSVMDNFEWQQGYTQRFGLYYVDFNDANRPRTAKASADWYRQVITTRTVTRQQV